MKIKAIIAIVLSFCAMSGFAGTINIPGSFGTDGGTPEKNDPKGGHKSISQSIICSIDESGTITIPGVTINENSTFECYDNSDTILAYFNDSREFAEFIFNDNGVAYIMIITESGTFIGWLNE